MIFILLLVIFEFAQSFETRKIVEGLEEGKIKSCRHRIYNFPLLIGVEDVDKL